MLKRFLVITFICLSVFSVGVCFAAGDFYLDDRSSLISYTSTARSYDTSALNGGVTRVSYGNSLEFDFYGEEIYLYAVSSTNSGRAAVYIDNTLIGLTTSTGVSQTLGSPQLVFSRSGMSSGKHHIVIISADSVVTNWNGTTSQGSFYFDYAKALKDFDISLILPLSELFLFALGLGLVIVYILLKNVFWRLNSDD